MDSLFDRILHIVQQTGERCVVVDRQTNTAVVLLPWPAYERSLGGSTSGALARLTSDELLEKINRDVAEWREANRDLEDDEISLGGAKNEADRQSRGSDQPPAASEQFYFEPIE